MTDTPPTTTNRQYISITPLLKRLWPSPAKSKVTADEIALAISHIFTDQLSAVQTGALLTALHFTGWDRRANVIAQCASAMRQAAVPVDIAALKEVIRQKRKTLQRGSYKGGLCDIVGTGGDDHSTFNVSTTASILASSRLLVAKLGNRASTSKSGSADLLGCTLPIPPNISAVNAETIRDVYRRTNYAFLFAPVFHPGMKYVATVRRELGWRTIFNLLGPLANPVDGAIEARLVGVARRDLGPVFAEALRMGGAKKAMVVCGEEDIDEISCAGVTYCWRLSEELNPEYRETEDGDDTSDEDDDDDDDDDAPPPRTVVHIRDFTLAPSDFGLPAHPLSTVSPGLMPQENAEILTRLLRNQLPADDPILHFVLMNTAALFEISGICDHDEESEGVIRERGPGEGRWKEGIRRARWAIESGEAWRTWNEFIQVSNSFDATTSRS
ncbi:MAG: anthranilate phosphoribosyltransferase [Peltula sp. TS41687]|nr:MAG: anthranilate phosphoribosyltransferase [Peltula sp. TS41687]